MQRYFFSQQKTNIKLELGFAMSFGQFIALASFILSAGTIAVTYWVGVAQETVNVCVPFITGCVFILMWWHCMRVWLKPSIVTRASRINLNLMTFFGMLAAVGLIWGTAVLAPTKEQVLWGPHIRGANTFFEGILLALSFNFYLIWRARKNGLLDVPSFKFKAVLFVLIWIVLVAFVANSVGEHMKRGTKIAEWWATLLICLYFLSSYWDWKKYSSKSLNLEQKSSSISNRQSSNFLGNKVEKNPRLW